MIGRVKRGEVEGTLRFGLWPGKPAWLIEPIVDLLGGRGLPEVSTRDGASVLEGLARLQGVRAPVVAVPVLALAAVLDRTGVAGAGAELMWTLSLAAVLVLPWYMVLLGALQVALRRSKHGDEPMALAHPKVWTSFRLAPLVAALLALACGVIGH